MEIQGRAFCLFEQSGVFRDAFKSFGIPAECYDIQNKYGQTDHIIDLFAEIEKGWNGEQSIFDAITPDDFIMAFFPCIFFTGASNPICFSLANPNYRRLTNQQKLAAIIDRSEKRQLFFSLLLRLCGIALLRWLRLVIENPYKSWAQQGFLFAGFLQSPAIVDLNRRERGDYYQKPTAYWFFGCEPEKGFSRDEPQKTRRSIWDFPSGAKERSEIAPAYARNFIADFLLGIDQGLEAPLFGKDPPLLVN